MSELTSRPQIVIDSEFEALIPPLTAEERAGLETQLVAEGCRDALVTWRGILLDGHNRFEICNRRSIAYAVRELVPGPADRDEAKIWIINNQFGRRNLQSFQRAELAIKLEPLLAEQAKKRMLAGKRTDPVPNLAQGSQRKPPVRDQVAKVANVSRGTIAKVKEIDQDADEETKAKLRRGEISIDKAHQEIRQRKTGAPKAKAGAQPKAAAKPKGSAATGSSAAESEIERLQRIVNRREYEFKDKPTPEREARLKEAEAFLARAVERQAEVWEPVVAESEYIARIEALCDGKPHHIDKLGLPLNALSTFAWAKFKRHGDEIVGEIDAELKAVYLMNRNRPELGGKNPLDWLRDLRAEIHTRRVANREKRSNWTPEVVSVMQQKTLLDFIEEQLDRIDLPSEAELERASISKDQLRTIIAAAKQRFSEQSMMIRNLMADVEKLVAEAPPEAEEDSWELRCRKNAALMDYLQKQMGFDLDCIAFMEYWSPHLERFMAEQVSRLVPYPKDLIFPHPEVHPRFLAALEKFHTLLTAIKKKLDGWQ